MKLRLANKILKAVGTPTPSAYTSEQIQRALDRTERTLGSRNNHAFWDAAMRALGPEGRARVVASWSPGDALDLLMRTPEEEWPGDPGALAKVDE